MNPGKGLAWPGKIAEPPHRDEAQLSMMGAPTIRECDRKPNCLTFSNAFLVSVGSVAELERA